MQRTTRGKDHTPIRTVLALPVVDAAWDGATTFNAVGPDLFSRRGVNRDDARPRSQQIHHVVHNNRIESEVAGAVRYGIEPRELELIDGGLRSAEQRIHLADRLVLQ